MSTSSTPSSDEIIAMIQALIASGALGRSPTYPKLLQHLAQETINGSRISEISVAVDVFDKDELFEVATDSTVRVYIYNLRKKLEAYYQGAGQHLPWQISIPKGEYRIAVEPNPHASTTQQPDSINPIDTTSPPVNAGKGRHIPLIVALLLGLLLGASLYAYWSKPAGLISDQQTDFWGAVLEEDQPVLMVIGDYYLFGETTLDEQTRLVREFDINSPEELLDQPAGINDPVRYDLGLTYLPRGAAFAQQEIQALLSNAGKRARITMMSELDADDIRQNHIVYLGYLSGLGVLEQFAFAGSSYEIGYSYDVIHQPATATSYISSVVETEGRQTFQDFGLLTAFTMQTGHRMVVLAGTRDAGLMEAAQLASRPDVLDTIALSDARGSDYLALFEVSGFNLTNIESQLIDSEIRVR